jgi:hypothetical protein
MYSNSLLQKSTCIGQEVQFFLECFWALLTTLERILFFESSAEIANEMFFVVSGSLDEISEKNKVCNNFVITLYVL